MDHTIAIPAARPVSRPARRCADWLSTTPGPTEHGRQRRTLLALFVVVIAGDQGLKWLAWRHVNGALINAGGYILLGRNVWKWCARPVTGAVCDVVGGVLLFLVIHALVCRPRRAGVLLGGGMATAGWVSNLLDRLGLHYWTAPDSTHGVVDFIPSGGSARCNIADLWIAVGTILFAFTVARSTDRRSLLGTSIATIPDTVPRRGEVGRGLAMGLVFLVVLAILGAGAQGVDQPSRATGATGAAIAGTTTAPASAA